MSATVPSLPPAQAAALAAAYDAATAKARLRSLLVAVVVAALALLAAWFAEVKPGALKDIAHFTDYLAKTIPTISAETPRADIVAWYWDLKNWARLLGETILMAYLGTLFGAIGGFVLCFLASANLVRNKAVIFLTRRFLEFCRTVPDVVFALIFVFAFGLGPVPGVLAISIHTAGALGKLFAEVVENIDMKPVEGLTATGATWVQRVRFGVVPQVLSNFASYGLLRFEINVRGAGVLGFVGAGGIGQEFLTAIRNFYYTDVSAILLMIIATVILIDLGTERIRHRLLFQDQRQ
ncbi:phosphonate uptake transporter [Azorhizobium caulinodans ORS 571]|uniref:Phosphonate uptake transporter n=1 Tax=Azorhizobium caulinodans (strain ATCC 43989 / DSM 5975 / JCM 20966 / LMG 6465 / NBRC 14845 / NCIMB 13405 / ORS 571) TaxID=438753 RepID=A8HQR6_AZOC5|nr:phosphonate ABC transporter, permease protein PhnE [Azorhizobium caulinodans]BAF87054.1 phosphonate uptake transporter [Azorhizobium caulinodans ORS 571]